MSNTRHRPSERLMRLTRVVAAAGVLRALLAEARGDVDAGETAPASALDRELDAIAERCMAEHVDADMAHYMMAAMLRALFPSGKEG